MSMFDFLLLGHLVGDFLLQTAWMAKHKATKWLPLLTHVTVYTAVIALFGLLAGGLSLSAIALIFISHVILDRRSFVQFWVKRVQMTTGSESRWLSIVADQIFHLLFLALAIALS
ncbi:DUF3307 domain-containing protein [Planococcus dechangensis]|uniref:DUF3307 domain-containing protein n=1 Tax=Planococcus dechangensis TaxID=1176255 RepID=A0ABV9M992_9BACL